MVSLSVPLGRTLSCGGASDATPSFSHPGTLAVCSRLLPFTTSFFPVTRESKEDFLPSCFLLSLVSLAASEFPGVVPSRVSPLARGRQDGRDMDFSESLEEASEDRPPPSPGSFQGLLARFSVEEKTGFFLKPRGDGDEAGLLSLVSFRASGCSMYTWFPLMQTLEWERLSVLDRRPPRKERPSFLGRLKLIWFSCLASALAVLLWDATRKKKQGTERGLVKLGDGAVVPWYSTGLPFRTLGPSPSTSREGRGGEGNEGKEGKTKRRKREEGREHTVFSVGRGAGSFVNNLSQLRGGVLLAPIR